MASVLIIGGQGRIGASIARDILTYTDTSVTVTGRHIPPNVTSDADLEANMAGRKSAMVLDLDDDTGLREAMAQRHSDGSIASHDLVIHCAGPFHYRDTRVVQHCIELGIDYLDVSDCVPFTRKVLRHNKAAQSAGITAIVNTGVFPGVSNSMVRLCMEGFERQTGRKADTIRLYYAVAGSGGAGVTVLRTTFLGLQQPFKAWINGQWQQKLPYSDRQTITFPEPYGKAGVYWYEVPETVTLADSFPVQTVITKFGSIPDVYNLLTWVVAHWFPKAWIRNPVNIEALSQISYRMTQVSDRFSGTGIAMVVEVGDEASGPPQNGPVYRATIVHEDTAIAAGAGTGSLAQLILNRQLSYPGVHPVEAALPTTLFRDLMAQRQIEIIESFSP